MQVRLGVPITAQEIRENAVDYLLQHPTIGGQHVASFIQATPQWLANLSQQGLQENSDGWNEALLKLYADDMRTSTTWADNIIIIAAVECLQYDLLIISSNPTHVDAFIQFTGSDGQGMRLTLGHHSEVHYLSLRPAEGKEDIKIEVSDDANVEEEQQREEVKVKEEQQEEQEEGERPAKIRRITAIDEGPLLRPVITKATLEDAHDYIRAVITEERSRGEEHLPQDDPLMNIPPGVTPYFINGSVPLKLFIQHQREEEGIDIEVINSERGQFALLNEEAITQYDEYRQTVPLNKLVYTSPAFFYFITQCWRAEPVRKIKQWAEDIWEVDYNMLLMFNEWLMYEKIYLEKEMDD